MTDISVTPTVGDLEELEKQALQLDTGNPTCLALLGSRRTMQYKEVLAKAVAVVLTKVLLRPIMELFTRFVISRARVHCFFVNTTQRGVAKMAANGHVNGHDADEFTNIADAYDTM